MSIDERFGFWPSPLGVDVAASLSVSVSTLRACGEAFYWIEGRPDLGGRRVVMSWDQRGMPTIVSPEGVSLTSRVHEYGGGAFDILDDHGPLIVGVSEDQAIVSFRPGDDKEKVLVEPTDGIARGGIAVNSTHGLVAWSEEEQNGDAVERRLVALRLAERTSDVIASGRDFFADVAFDDVGMQVAWMAWDHPYMPWDAGEIWLAELDVTENGVRVHDATCIAGGVGSPSSRPSFCANGALAYLSEVDGRVQPVRRDRDGIATILGGEAGEFGGPLWVLGERQVIEARGTLFSIYRDQGRGVPVRLGGPHPEAMSSDATSVDDLAATPSCVAWISPTKDSMATLEVVNVETGERVTLSLGPSIPLRPGDFSPPVGVRGKTRHGDDVFGLFYEPRNADIQSDGAPPVIVLCHGGPTAAARAGFSPIVHAYTTRGFAVVAINYSGSTGYGAAYRHRLDEQWGIRDVEDCVDLVASLGDQGLVDPTRAAIQGGSAGGFTALLGLTTGAFLGAVSLYGVADLVTLAASTHDFESRYLDWLIGKLPGDEARYVERSPVTRAHEMRGAALLLQGLDDPVVPPDQARAMASALRANGHAVELIEFEGESHGFRRLDTLVACLEAQIAFYQDVLCRGDVGDVH